MQQQMDFAVEVVKVAAARKTGGFWTGLQDWQGEFRLTRQDNPIPQATQ